MTPLLGCIADDVTGATDLALNLVQGGARTIQFLDVPRVDELTADDVEAVVVALKIRSIPARKAVAQAVTALDVLRHANCQRFYFKYCSTFDSTDQGNIGPVAEALMDELGAGQTIFCPAFPEVGRTVYAGHLFVHAVLLNESGMQNHPLNPMADANLVRVLRRQVGRSVGLLEYSAIQAGPQAARLRLAELEANGFPLVLTDALDKQHLECLAEAVAGQTIVTGGSGLARFLPAAYQTLGLLTLRENPGALPTGGGRVAILAGSCSAATRGQVAWMRERCPAWQVDVEQLIGDSGQHLDQALTWVGQQDRHLPLLFYSTAAPEIVAAIQQRHGSQTVAAAVERFHAALAVTLTGEYGVQRLIVAGGETSGAVVRALGIRALRIGPAIAPGVPWTQAMGPVELELALKSGNFGDEAFFQKAIDMRNSEVAG